VHFRPTYKPWGPEWLAHVRANQIPANGIYCFRLGKDVCSVPGHNGDGNSYGLEAFSNHKKSESERTWLLDGFVGELQKAGRLFTTSERCLCAGKPKPVKPPRKASLWNLFMHAHQEMYKPLARSGFRQIQEKYGNLNDQERADWKERLEAGEGLTAQEKVEWWELHDDLPPTTRPATKRPPKRKRNLSTGSTSTPAAPTAKQATDDQKAADPIDGQRKKQQVADQRFRKRCETIERFKLEDALQSKSDSDLLRIFAKLNQAGQTDKRRWRKNYAIEAFIRIRYIKRSYEMICRGCRRIRDKQKCNCPQWTCGEAARTVAAPPPPATGILQRTTRDGREEHGEAPKMELGGINWMVDVEVVNAFVGYLVGPNQEVHHEKTLASYTKRFTEFVHWHRGRELSAGSGETPFSHTLVASHLAAKYMADLSETTRESFTGLHVLVCRWIASLDPKRFLEAADDLNKAQQRKRQKRQTRTRRLRATLPEALLSVTALDAFRRKVVTGLAADLEDVTDRLERGKSTPDDRLYMSMLVPAVLVTAAKPLRPCDIQAISLAQAAILAEGTPLVVEEQKTSCANVFTYVPSNACVQHCLKVYTTLLRPFLAAGGGHSYKKPAAQATDADVKHLVTALRTTKREQMVTQATSKRARSKYAWILANCPPAAGWSTDLLTADDLRVAFNKSEYNTQLVLDERGNANCDIGRVVKMAFTRYGGEGLTVTGFRKLLETVAARFGAGGGAVAVTGGDGGGGGDDRVVQSLITWGCDHTNAVANRHYVIRDRTETLRIGLRFSKFYELSDPPLPSHLFMQVQNIEEEEEEEEEEEGKEAVGVPRDPEPHLLTHVQSEEEEEEEEAEEDEEDEEEAVAVVHSHSHLVS